jgi:hypothetical protein
MPVNAAIPFPGVEPAETCTYGGNELTERRRRARLQLRWSVWFFRESGREPLSATTLNISSEGFYCLSDFNFVPGQVLSCLMLVPTHDPEERERRMALDCRVRVVRVSEREVDRTFGIACRIEDYRFIQI